ncbi:APC family permease [Flavihumibacter sp. RY-1]|uniref:APC family permease n=1 Tax=Flavihumibacter fluminis TaxID=2909236 RepID=A0ABS9BKT0_9BACT|nr:APC family permease [Flavihumibacter fluminis]MCF1716301.1 APC family permease [Flavihumibacter fluminis]
MQNNSGKNNQLRLFDLTMIVVGLVIGMGIFRTATDAASASLTPTIYFSAWIAGGIIALCGALTYAEIGSRYPVTGGYYKIFAACYHPSVAFAINCIILISNAASLSGVALIGSEYLSQLIFDEPASDLVKSLIAMSAIMVFYFVNLAGLRMSSQTQNILMLIKILMVLVLISALFFPGADPSSLPPSSIPPSSIPPSSLIYSFGVALIAVSFTYGGYQQTINFGEEVKDARKNLPRGIVIGILMIIGLYLLVQMAYVHSIGFEALKSTRGIAAVVAEKMFGPTGKTIFTLLLFLAVLAYVNVLLLSNPRVMYAMSKDGILPGMFAKTDEKRGVLTVSLTVFAAICIIVLFFANTFEKILGFTIFLDSIGMATSAATIFILRKRTKHLDGTGIYTMKWYPVLPLVFMIAYTFVGISIAINTPVLALTGLAVFAVFLGIYFLVVRKSKGIKHS